MANETYNDILNKIKDESRDIVEETAIYEDAKNNLFKKYFDRTQKYRPDRFRNMFKDPEINAAYNNLTKKEFTNYIRRKHGWMFDNINQMSDEELLRRVPKNDLFTNRVLELESRIGDKLNKGPLYGPRVEQGLKTNLQIVEDDLDVLMKNRMGIGFDGAISKLRNSFLGSQGIPESKEELLGKMNPNEFTDYVKRQREIQDKLLGIEDKINPPSSLQKVKNVINRGVEKAKRKASDVASDISSSINRTISPYYDGPVQRFMDSPAGLKLGNVYDKILPDFAVEDFKNNMNYIGRKLGPLAKTAGAVAASPFVSVPLGLYGAKEYLTGSPLNPYDARTELFRMGEANRGPLAMR